MKTSETTCNRMNGEKVLLGTKACLRTIFPDEEGRPSDRTFTQWRLDGYFPSIKIGRRIFLDPVVVRKALAKRFTIQAID
jgi:hypothetical protein